MFPGTNISTSDDESPTFIHQLKKLHKQGVSHVTMVAGSDRIDEYKKLLDRYNGPSGEFNFKNIDVVSAGERDPDAEGVTGMSASKMRGHAISNKFSEFKKGIPAHVHPEHARELFNDVRKGMDIQIGPDTPGISLARYAKRNDPIGVKARAEQQRRLAQKKTKKTIKEEETTADIRGLGYVTGNPIVDTDVVTQYQNTNMATADTHTDILNKVLERMHLRHHSKVAGAHKHVK
jgi:hypothetical protein